jgi:hypothetical protein
MFKHPLPEVGSEERDREHMIRWVGIETDPTMGAQLSIQIFKLKHGRPAGKGRSLTVSQLRYDYFREHSKPIHYFLPPSDAQMRKVKQTGELYAMPGMITD